MLFQVFTHFNPARLNEYLRHPVWLAKNKSLR